MQRWGWYFSSICSSFFLGGRHKSQKCKVILFNTICNICFLSFPLSILSLFSYALVIFWLLINQDAECFAHLISHGICCWVVHPLHPLLWMHHLDASKWSYWCKTITFDNFEVTFSKMYSRQINLVQFWIVWREQWKCTSAQQHITDVKRCFYTIEAAAASTFQTDWNQSSDLYCLHCFQSDIHQHWSM